jgi:hypothetical protein
LVISDVAGDVGQSIRPYLKTRPDEGTYKRV